MSGGGTPRRATGRIAALLGVVLAALVAAAVSAYCFAVFQVERCGGSGLDPVGPAAPRGTMCGGGGTLLSGSLVAFVVAGLLGAGLVVVVWRNAGGRWVRLVGATAPVVVPLAALGLLWGTSGG